MDGGAAQISKHCTNCHKCPHWATIHPGITLQEALDKHSITPDDLADRIGFSRAHVAQVLRYERGIGLPLAVQLEFILGVPVMFWLKLQAQYEKEVADFLAKYREVCI